MRTTSQLGDTGKGFCSRWITAVLKQKYRYPDNAQLASEARQIVRVLLYAIANEYQRIDLAMVRLLYSVLQYPRDLRLPSPTANGGHPR